MGENNRMPAVIAGLLLFAGCSVFRSGLSDEMKQAGMVSVPALFGSHMVMQRNAPIPVWGSADPGSKVIVRLGYKKQVVHADHDGEWSVEMPSMKAGGPYELVVIGKNVLRFTDVYIGDVWVCSGQSNMEMSVVQCVDAEKEIAGADFPGIRLLSVEHNASTVPLNDIGTAGWQVCSPGTVKDFSAVAYFFGRRLHESLKVPIGLIQTAWGGTVAEAWMSKSGLRSFPEFAGEVQKFKEDSTLRYSYEEQQKLYKKAQQDWVDTVDSLDAGLSPAKSWADPSLFTDDWTAAVLPGLWEGTDIGNYDGVVWYRKGVVLPDSSKPDGWTLSLGMIDDIDVTWVNGVRVGSMDVYNQAREYPVPDGVILPGMNVIAVRIVDHHGGGGFWGAPETLVLKGNRGEKISLAGDWKVRLGIESGRVPAIPPEITGLENTPTVLYNAMIHPLIPCGLRGVIWYQGESNAGHAWQYRSLFPALIRNWRNKWNEDFPFLFVQLANYRARQQKPGDSDWAELREAQTMTLSVPNTGMAVAIDIGDALDIHPKNKQEVGKRLALNALANVYGEATLFSGPVYRSFRKENDKIRVFFKYATGGLEAKNDSLLRGFSIAAEDSQFVWADARIDGESVIVSSTRILNPVAVRYAWADNPVCNLYNAAGLPASPFRTDDWPGITWPK